jgi:hypothetical protein
MGVLMQNQSLCEWRQFSGSLQDDAFVVPVNFRAHLNSSGEIEFDFDPIALTKDTLFIRDSFSPKGTPVGYCSLVGQADDGTELEIERINLSYEEFFDSENSHILLKQGHYTKATFARNLAETRHKSLIKMWLIGFKRSHPLTQDCPLGTISMVEYPAVDDFDDLTGFLQIEAKSEISDISIWRNEATKLLEHVRLIMSFASGLMLRVPLVEFYARDKLVVDVLSQIRQVSTASFPVFDSYKRNPIFEAAVNSFFDSPFDVKNLFIAIEWFVMDSSYAEVRLVNAMTVLENLISSNLEENDIWIMQDKKEFAKCRKLLRNVLRQGIEKWSTEDRESQKKTLADINENLANLNRLSLRQKLDILASRWSIPLEVIGETRIKSVINARNSIVHQGHYNIGHNNNLWGLAMVARELVICFIFRAIGFHGEYISHLEKSHLAYFPPQNDS